MQTIDYSHRSGETVLGPALCHQMQEALASVTFEVHRNCARELRTSILEALTIDGWSDEVQIARIRRLTITAMHGRVGLCLQTGNMARFYADLLKLQAQFLDDNITGAFYLIPTGSCARIMGENIANYERLTAELSEVFNKAITVPIMVIGFENEEES